MAQFRIKIGKEISSAALIVDGYHAHVDGLVSLAVIFCASGIWFGCPLADPNIGLPISAAIFRIVWKSSKSIYTRMFDVVLKMYKEKRIENNQKMSDFEMKEIQKGVSGDPYTAVILPDTFYYYSRPLPAEDAKQYLMDRLQKTG